MSALDDLIEKFYDVNKDNETALDWVVVAFSKEHEGNETFIESAAAELAAIRYLVAVASDVNEWLKTLDTEDEGHQDDLEAALKRVREAE